MPPNGRVLRRIALPKSPGPLRLTRRLRFRGPFRRRRPRLRGPFRSRGQLFRARFEGRASLPSSVSLEGVAGGQTEARRRPQGQRRARVPVPGLRSQVCSQVPPGRFGKRSRIPNLSKLSRVPAGMPISRPRQEFLSGILVGNAHRESPTGMPVGIANRECPLGIPGRNACRESPSGMSVGNCPSGMPVPSGNCPSGIPVGNPTSRYERALLGYFRPSSAEEEEAALFDPPPPQVAAAPRREVPSGWFPLPPPCRVVRCAPLPIFASVYRARANEAHQDARRATFFFIGSPPSTW